MRCLSVDRHHRTLRALPSRTDGPSLIPNPGTPGFHFFHSNDLAALADRLSGRVIESRRRDPLQPLNIVVPHPGLGRWLSVAMAERHGISANMEFSLATETIWKWVRENEADLPEAHWFAPGTLAMHCMALLGDESPIADDLEILAPFRRADRDADRAQMAQRLGMLFANYLIYRPQWINRWNRGQQPEVLSRNPDARWQAKLWGAIRERMAGRLGRSVADPATIMCGLLERGQTGDLFLKTPEKLTLFGFSQLPPLFMEFLQLFSDRGTVDLYMPNPCAEYWEDIRSDRGILMARLKGEEPSSLERSSGEHLLGAFGRQGQEFMGLLHEHVDDQSPESDAVEYRVRPGTRLGLLQARMAHLNRDADVLPADGSISLHDHVNELREIEGLFDFLLGKLGEPGDPNPIQARDVLVLAPDIDRYAPYIKAVFGQGNVDFNLSDRRTSEHHPLIIAFRNLLSLPASRLTSNEVFHLLKTTAVAERFDVDSEGLDRIHAWLSATHVHWGLDAQHREGHGAAHTAIRTWSQAMDRILVGSAVDDESSMVAGRVVPLRNIEGSESRWAGSLADLLASLRHLLASLETPRSIPQWTAKLQSDLVSAFFRVDRLSPEDDRALTRILDAMDQVRMHAEHSDFDESVSWLVVREWVLNTLDEHSAQHGFLSGGVTFANMVPMRSIPARVVCLLGINEGEFPRRTRPLPFDLAAQKSAPGDRSTTSDDRYLFLEIVSQARDALYISYRGRDARTGTQQAPSPVIAELITAVGKDTEGNTIAPVVYPAQPVSEAAFDPLVPEKQSFADHWLTAARASQRREPAEPSYFVPPDPVVEDGGMDFPSLEELAAYLKNPTRFGLSRIHQMDFHDDDDTLDEETEDSLRSGLSGYSIRQRLVEVGLDNNGQFPDSLPGEHWWGTGALPPGLRARDAVYEALPECRSLAQKILTLGDAQTLLRWVKTPLGSDTIAGAVHPAVRLIKGGNEWEFLCWRPGRMKGSWLASHIPGWLAWQLQHGPTALHVFTLEKDTGAAHTVYSAHENPGSWLRELVEIFQSGNTIPQPYFPDAAWTYVQAIQSGDDIDKARVSAHRRLTGKYGELTQEEAALTFRQWPSDALVGERFHRFAWTLFAPLLAAGETSK